MKLALFDLDNTLIEVDSDYEWAQFLIEEGMLDRDTYEARNLEFFELYKQGTLNVLEFLDFQLKPLSLYSRPQLDAWHAQFMARKILPWITPASRELIAQHGGDGWARAIITATNSFVTAPIAREFGIEALIATEPEEKDGGFTGGVSGIPCFRADKVVRLRQWLGERGQPLESFEESWFYSDSHNDLPLLQSVTHPVAVDPDEVLADHAKAHGWPVISLRRPKQ